ncbi:Hypothetical protein R9X50_00191200 [Acrodontium crateriforme]|uniref:Beta-glucuronidase C-terminal domain-containing protein n=1 Tax=Acrodontium crateriforme TaxID=150365 RepID=A0AAQ3LZZ4_9PEZI|nr:Hypothetical protein R9X50_00191200 [Acrodontium crateriforme]
MTNLKNSLFLLGATAYSYAYSVPSSPPSNASPQLEFAPIGVSLEFFAFPEYMYNVPSTKQCLQNLKDVSGTWPPMRVGGTTQDRATYDASSTAPVTYSVSDPDDAPDSLNFGPSFISLAGQYSGRVVLGLNRRLNNQANTIEAAQTALSKMNNLDAIELGNEPNFYTGSDPIAGGSWNAAKDYASQVSWQNAVGNAIGATNIFSAGVYFGTGSFNNAGLANDEGSDSEFVADFCSHNYPQSGSTADLASLMSHSGISSQISQFRSQVTAASSLRKSFIMGETNSATQGGGGISPTFGSALWVMDYSIQLLLMGTKSIYFHQGTIGNCQYCWWGRYSMGAPYYGAYFATLALASADHVAMLDDASSAYATYIMYKSGQPIRALLYNSDYYTSGSRSSHDFTLDNLNSLKGKTISAKLLTAPSATSRQDQGQNPSVAGQTFQNGTCNLQGSVNLQTGYVSSDGSVTFSVGASQALLVDLS